MDFSGEIMTVFQKISEVIKTEKKFLFFQRITPDMENLANYYLAFGVITAWIVGIGRYWDNPRAQIWQYFGLGSVAYIFILALILWLLIMPLKPENWSYKSVLIFVGMTSLPGILYAIPVERFFTMETASLLNVIFLGFVATWRVILLFLYMIRSAKLSGLSVVVACVLPLTIIVSVLAILNLEHVVFRIMAGIAEDERSANDLAYTILLLITYFSYLASPVLLITYIVMIFKRRKEFTKTSDELSSTEQ